MTSHISLKSLLYHFLIIIIDKFNNSWRPQFFIYSIFYIPVIITWKILFFACLIYNWRNLATFQLRFESNFWTLDLSCVLEQTIIECLFKIYICFLFLTFSGNAVSLTATMCFSRQNFAVSFFKCPHSFSCFFSIFPSSMANYVWSCKREELCFHSRNL